tara:strand:- start:1257 stop:2909 length:1653 start_codon:yes stop_codon:yes gene_type:complete
MELLLIVIKNFIKASVKRIKLAIKMVPSSKSLETFIILLICCSIFGYSLWLNLAWSNIETIQAKSFDEYIFHGVLLKMHAALLAGDIRMLFAYNFYSYGFAFFLLNYMAVMPFFADSLNPILLIMPRIISSSFMVMSLIVLDIILKNFSASNFERAGSIFFLILMPGLWFNATWFHPDFMMTGLLMLSIYFLSRDILPTSSSFNAAIIFWAIAMAVKIQAISMAPLFLWLFFLRKDIYYLRQENILLLGKFFLQTITIYVIMNPYLLHPDGMNAWLASQLSEALKMVPDNTSEFISIIERLNFAVLDFYLPLITYIGLICIALSVFIQDLKDKTASFYGALCFTFLLNIGYLLFFVNKGWNHYYLPLAFMAPLILILGLKSFLASKNYQLTALLFILGVQSYAFIPVMKDNFFQRLDYQVVSRDSLYRYSPFINSYKDMNSKNEELYEVLQNRVNQNTKILSHAYIGFPFRRLNMSYNQVTIIQHKLTSEDIDSFEALKDSSRYMLLRKETIGGIKNNFVKELILGRDGLTVLEETDNFSLVGFRSLPIN